MTKFRPEKYGLASDKLLNGELRKTRGYLNERISYILGRMDMLEKDFAACDFVAPTEDVDAPLNFQIEAGKFSFNPEKCDEPVPKPSKENATRPQSEMVAPKGDGIEANGEPNLVLPNEVQDQEYVPSDD